MTDPSLLSHEDAEPSWNTAASRARVDFEVLIVGAGFGGIGAAIELMRAGVESFLIVDRNDGIGGVWRVNTYPGVAADLPLAFYSYSYAPPRKWTQFFPSGAEVREYLEQVAEDYSLHDRLRFNTTIVNADWDENSHRWIARSAAGQVLISRFLICGVGPFSSAKMPDIPGLLNFQGKIVHTAQWDHDYDYHNKRIAVIGNGASGLQLIPELARIALSLTVYQRTPSWVAPKPDFSMTPLISPLLSGRIGRKLVRILAASLIDIAISGLSTFHSYIPFMIPMIQRIGSIVYYFSVRDRALNDRLTPTFAPYCKAVSISSRYLRTFTLDHVELVTDAIKALHKTSVITGDGRSREVDVLVCATGFHGLDDDAIPSFKARGRGGTDLHHFWRAQRFQAYQGVSIPGFPNFFLLTGPYAYPGGSWVSVIECTSKHAARVIAASRSRSATAAEVRNGPHKRYWHKCLRRAGKTIWLSDRCSGSNTKVLDNHGDPTLIRPSLHWEMWRGNARVPLDHYAYSTTEMRE